MVVLAEANKGTARQTGQSRLPALALALLAMACAAAVGIASARHTGSLAFPIDDGYIYSNYVLSASQGHFFSYNMGEASGGITGLGWYIVCVLAYWLLAPFHALLGGLAPTIVRPDAQLAQQAGHLYLAAYLPGALCLATTAVGVYRLALLCLPDLTSRKLARHALCWLLGAVAAADLGLVWGALSGLEITLASALAVWAIVFLVDETRRGQLRFALLFAALLPWARPDLMAISFAGLLWLAWRALTHRDPETAIERRTALVNVGFYLAAMAVGFGAMSLVYFVGWGKPLPSSFYAKVGGLRLSGKFFAAAQEFVLAGNYLPFVAGALALAGGVSQWLIPVRNGQRGGDRDQRESSSAALLLLMVSIIYTVGLMASLPWFGQEDRYLLPLHPFIIVLVGMLLLRTFQLRIAGYGLRIRNDPTAGNNPQSAIRNPQWIGAVAAILVLVAVDYLWATRVYAVEVRNIEDAHIKPALWIAQNSAPGSIVASEPIGAVKLFSGRRTVDLVGLTTPATLGTFEDWPRAWPVLKAAGASYLLFYPDWFDRHKPPGWAVQGERFAIPDNRIAGADVIAVYSLQWDRYVSSVP